MGYGKRCSYCHVLNHCEDACYWKQPELLKLNNRHFVQRNLKGNLRAQPNDVKIAEISSGSSTPRKSEETKAFKESENSAVKKVDDSENSKASIDKISDDNFDKLEAVSCKDSVNEETDATEPTEVNNELEGNFGFSVSLTALAQNQDSAKPPVKVSKYQKLLNEPLEIEDSVRKFEIEAEGLRNYVMNLIETTDEIKWFESKWIRNVVTDLGGIVLGKFVEKLRQLKNEEARKGSKN